MIVEAMKTMNHVPSSAEGLLKRSALRMANQLNLGKR